MHHHHMPKSLSIIGKSHHLIYEQSHIHSPSNNSITFKPSTMFKCLLKPYQCQHSLIHLVTNIQACLSNYNLHSPFNLETSFQSLCQILSMLINSIDIIHIWPKFNVPCFNINLKLFSSNKRLELRPSMYIESWQYHSS